VKNNNLTENKVPVTINGKTVYVSAEEAQKFLKKASTEGAVAVETNTGDWKGNQLILG